MRISDWSSDVCSSDLIRDSVGKAADRPLHRPQQLRTGRKLWQCEAYRGHQHHDQPWPFTLHQLSTGFYSTMDETRIDGRFIHMPCRERLWKIFCPHLSRCFHRSAEHMSAIQSTM